MDFTLSNSFTNATLPAGQNVTVGIATSYDQPSSGSGSENLTLTIVPTTTIPTVATAPTVDGQADGAYAGAETLDIGKIWQGASGCSGTADCGSSPGTGSDTAKVVQSGDALYFFVHVNDDYQSYAVKPSECVGHWQADSVEFLIDPRGNSSQNLTDTASTFKLGVFPYTNDPSGSNGNGPNGPCWSRDADNHQGYSTGPLASTVDAAPNAPGVQVATTARWVGSNETTVDHAYAGGGYDLEVKIPIADLPAKPDLDHMGLNVTPYDNDDTSAAGTTTLRHIDMSTRLGWSALGSVQSDPYRWGHASISGYTPGAAVNALPTTAPDPNVSHPNLDGVNSPETIAMSARDGVPISGREPAPENDRIAVTNTKLRADRAEMDITATGPGTARVFLWSGNEGYIPVWTTSCSPKEDPPPDYGFTACAKTDGGIPPWGTDMSGRIVHQQTVAITAPGTTHISIPLDAAARAALARDGSALVSFETPNNEVQAFDEPLAQVKMTVDRSKADEPGETDLRAELTGNDPFPGDVTGTVQFQVRGTNLGDPVAIRNGVAVLTVQTGQVAGQDVTAVYSGDADYAARTVTLEATPGPPGPHGPKGDTPSRVAVKCLVARSHKQVRCTVKAMSGKLSRGTRFTTKVKVKGRARTASKTGRRTVTVKLKVAKKLTRKSRVVLTIRSGKASTRMTIKPGAKTRKAWV